MHIGAYLLLSFGHSIIGIVKWLPVVAFRSHDLSLPCTQQGMAQVIHMTLTLTSCHVTSGKIAHFLVWMLAETGFKAQPSMTAYTSPQHDTRCYTHSTPHTTNRMAFYLHIHIHAKTDTFPVLPIKSIHSISQILLPYVSAYLCLRNSCKLRCWCI